MQSIAARRGLISGVVTTMVFLISGFSVSAVNLLIDPGLELQTAGTGNGTNGGWNVANGAVKNSTYTNHTVGGTLSLRLPPGASSTPLAWQNIGTITGVGAVSAGMQFQLTGYGFITNSITTGRALVQATFFSSSFVNLGTVETAPGVAKTSNNIDSNSVVKAWIPLDTGVFTAPAGTAYMQVYGIGINLQPNGNSVWLDDFDLQLIAIPEPSTIVLVLMGLVGLPFLARRRSKVVS